MGINKTAKPESNDIVYELSSCFLIDHGKFSKASAAAQTGIIANSVGKPIVFNENIAELKDRRRLRDKILAGKEVSVELELCEISLTREEHTLLQQLRPVLDRIYAATPYPWLLVVDDDESLLAKFSLSSTRLRLNGYALGPARAKRIWDAASNYWRKGGAAMLRLPELVVDGYRRRPDIYKDRVEIGCQTISRAEVEALARYYGWEPSE